jgi:predicted phosphodiesterase
MDHNIWFCGDLHGNFARLNALAVEKRPAAVILLGDLEAGEPLERAVAPILDAGIELRWIPGNHDSDSDLVFQHSLASDLVHLNLHGRVDTVAGVRIAGLGGVFRQDIWHPDVGVKHESYAEYVRALDESRPARERGQGPKDAADVGLIKRNKERTHTTSIFPDVYDRLAAEDADVLVVHEAPSCHPNGFAAIDELARAMKVKRVFHGHHHDRLDFREQWFDMGFKTFGVGLCGITALDGTVVLAGVHDEARRSRLMP